MDIYRPLQGDQIRIAHVHPGTWNDTVECLLEVVSLSSSPSYHALSYVWGDANPKVGIKLNTQAHEARINLYNALRHLRLQSEELIIWIDAICINQSDAVERTQQVKMMTNIYKMAKRVVIWLGVGSGETERVMAAMGRVSNRLITQNIQRELVHLGNRSISTQVAAICLEELGDLDSNSIWFREIKQSLLDVPWWSRVWIKQEFAVAAEVYFVCGHAILESTHFANTTQAIIYLILDPNLSFGNYGSAQGFGLKLAPLLTEREAWQRGYRRSMLELVLRFGNAFTGGASDHRDRIYALLGLADDDLGIQPDYTQDVVHVYCNFVKAHLRSNYPDTKRKLSIILSHAQVKKGIDTLPSWTPDWSIYGPFKISSVLPEAWRLYSAYGKLNSQPPIPSTTEDLRILRVLGIRFATIKAIGPEGRVSDDQEKTKIEFLYPLFQQLVGDVTAFFMSNAASASTLPPNQVREISGEHWSKTRKLGALCLSEQRQT